MNSGSYSPFSANAAAASTKLLDTFVTEMPTCFTSFGSRPFGLRDAVLDVDRGDVEVAREIEGDRDRRRPVVAARRRHVLHALDAVDRLLERVGDRGLDRLGVRAVVERRHQDARRRQLGKLRDRQRRNRDGAGKDDHQRADARQNRTADEDVGNHDRRSALENLSGSAAGLRRARPESARRPSASARPR